MVPGGKQGVLARLLGRRGLFREVPVPGALWAVGDIHGYLDLYRALEARIAAAPDGGGGRLIVLLGDIIDRGPDSRGMIAHLLSPPPEGVERLCLLGNHEDMLLRFLAAPATNAAWLDFGGLETAASYGVSTTGMSPEAVAGALAAAIPAQHLAFLRALTPGLAIGRHLLCHAGTAPGVPVDRQTRADLIWPRYGTIPDLAPPPDLGERIVVHGHVPVPEARQEGWRINVDTGAYATGRLTAVRLSETDAPVFLHTGG
jgi:serine/threonine protein phosphatase 1